MLILTLILILITPFLFQFISIFYYFNTRTSKWKLCAKLHRVAVYKVLHNNYQNYFKGFFIGASVRNVNPNNYLLNTN